MKRVRNLTPKSNNVDKHCYMLLYWYQRYSVAKGSLLVSMIFGRYVPETVPWLGGSWGHVACQFEERKKERT